MLRYLVLFWVFDLSIAQTNCKKSAPEIALPSCMDECFQAGNCGSCPCPNNLKGWCEMSSEGPASWFARWGQCVLSHCPDDGDITNLMTLYVSQCDGAVGGPINNVTVPYPLRDWAPTAPQYLSQSSTSASSTATSRSVATLTGVFPATTSSTTSRSDGSEATVLDGTASTASQATGTVSPAPILQEVPESTLSVAAIIGIAVGGTVLLTLLVGFVACILRRRKRKQLPIAVSPPSYEAADTKETYHKPELDGQLMKYQYSKADAAAAARSSTMYAELDGGAQSSPVRELPSRS